jgi:hypothetical protein
MLGQRIEAGRVSELVRAARATPTPWLEFDRDEFQRHYNRTGFSFPHRLAEHPLFRLEPLVDLCRRRRDLVLHRSGTVPVNTDFDRAFDEHTSRLSFEEALANPVETRSYFMISNAEKDAVYRPAIEELLGEIAAQSETLDPGMNWWSTYIFISSETSVTPYHMDREMNFLLQIRGEKLERLWDADVMSQRERETLLGNASAARPAYSPALDERAKVYSLTPGVGVHHPFIAPHVVETRSSLSISLAITFRTRGSDVCSDAFRCNYRLRQLGLRPRPVGVNAAQDRLRAKGFRLASGAYKLVRDRVRPSPEPDDRSM